MFTLKAQKIENEYCGYVMKARKLIFHFLFFFCLSKFPSGIGKPINTRLEFLCSTQRLTLPALNRQIKVCQSLGNLHKFTINFIQFYGSKGWSIQINYLTSSHVTVVPCRKSLCFIIYEKIDFSFRFCCFTLSFEVGKVGRKMPHLKGSSPERRSQK